MYGIVLYCKKKAHNAKESNFGSETPPTESASRDITYHHPYQKKKPNKNQNKHKEKTRSKQTRLISYPGMITFCKNCIPLCSTSKNTQPQKK